MTAVAGEYGWRTCEHCRWWDSSVQRNGAQPDTTGLCRFLPPRINEVTGRAMWPFTEDVDWCGEFASDGSAER